MTSSRNSHLAALSFFQTLKTRRSSCLTVSSDACLRSSISAQYASFPIEKADKLDNID